MEKTKGKTTFLRCLGLLLVVLAPVFGVTWKPAGVCLGDQVLTNLGLKAWSDGSQGIHYAALYGLVLMAAGCALFASTTRNWKKGFRWALWLCLGVFVLVGVMLQIV